MHSWQYYNKILLNPITKQWANSRIFLVHLNRKLVVTSFSENSQVPSPFSEHLWEIEGVLEFTF